MVFKEDIDLATTPMRRAVPTGERRNFEQLLKDINRVYPGASVSGIGLPRDIDAAYSAYVTHNRRFIEVFVDPFSGRVTGERYGDHIMNIIRRIHVNLYWFGWQGRVAVGASGAVMLVSAMTGLLIYLPFLRGVFRQGLRWWQIRSGRLQLATSDWHKLIGVTASIFTLVLSLTGFILGIDRYLPRSLHRVPLAVKGSDAVRIGANDAMRIALERLPIEPTALLLPIPGSPRYTIYGDLKGSFARRAANFIVVHASTGAVVDVYDSREVTPTTRFYNWMEPLHFGDFGGITLKIIYCVFGLAMSFLPASGFLLWLLKR